MLFSEYRYISPFLGPKLIPFSTTLLTSPVVLNQGYSEIVAAEKF